MIFTETQGNGVALRLKNKNCDFGFRNEMTAAEK